MDSKEAQSQIAQMTAFIKNEAKDKAEEIGAKALEEFHVEKFKLVNQMKDKIRQEYAKKAKQVETQCAIKKSMAINKSRLEKIRARQEVLAKIADDAKEMLTKQMSKEADAKDLNQKLIVQGLLMLLEDEVVVQCRQSDVAVVKGVLDKAAAQYADVIKKQTGALKSVKLTLDQGNFLPPAAQRDGTGPSCLGGVRLHCQNSTIVIDNTIDARLALVLEQDKPAIRKSLFPSLAK